MKAVQYALGWLIVWIGGLIQLPMMIVQFVMECLCYLFLPIAISLFAFESTKGLAIRYVQQTLAILAWPIGFAVVDLVGYSLLTSAGSAASAGALAAGLATGFTPVKLVIGGIVAIWLILGSLVTPIVMQMLFCSGTPMSSAVGQANAIDGQIASLGQQQQTATDQIVTQNISNQNDQQMKAQAANQAADHEMNVSLQNFMQWEGQISSDRTEFK